MTFEFYKILHIIGIIMLFLGVGGAVVNSILNTKSNPIEKFVLMNHGVGLLIIIIAGFGMLAKMGGGMQFPGWIIIKVVIWLVMGALIMFIKKKPGLKTLWWYLALTLGTLAGYLALFKPF